MANLHQILLAVLIIQIQANAAPSEITEKKVDPEPIVAKVNDSTNVEEDKNDAIAQQGQRQKRQFFNYIDNGLPSFNPFYQGPNLDQSAQAGGYGFEDPYALIHRRLQDILENFRRPAYNIPVPFPPRGLFQFLVPVIYIPQDCNCFPDQIPPDNQIPNFNFDFPSNNQIPTENETPIDNQTPRVDEMHTDSPIPDSQNSTSNQMPATETPNNNQSVDDRIPDETLPENQTPPPNPEQPDTGDDDEFTRPISFDPIPPPIRPPRPPPTVNHGIMQAGLPDSNATAPNTTDSEEDFTRPISFDPIPPSNNGNRPQPAVDHGIMQAGSAQSAVTTAAPLESAVPLIASSEIQNRFGLPDPASATVRSLTACDMAILNCCHQPEVKLSCFALENCPQLITNNPCSANVVLSAIDRYQHFYGEKSW